jgi:predicted phosphodiesterase
MMTARFKRFAANAVLITAAMWAVASAGLRAEEVGLTFFGWSDQHVQANGDGKHVLPAIEAINSLPGTKYPESIGGVVAAPAMVLGCGDMTDHPTAAARDTYQDLITRRLKYPAYDVLGNHDEGGDHPTETMKDWFCSRYGSLTYSIDRGGVHFIILYSHFDESLKNPAQAVTREALDALRAELAKVAKGTPVVVALHLCFDSLTNREEFVDALGDANVVLVLAGHYHKSKVTTHRGIYFVQFPSPAVNLVREPPAKPAIGATEVMVLRITPDRLLAIPYDYKAKTWVDKPGKMLDAAMPSPAAKEAVNQ